MKQSLLIFILLIVVSCKENKNTTNSSSAHNSNSGQDIEVKYATGFEIKRVNDGYTLVINKPWPGSTDIYTYHFSIKSTGENNEIQIPINHIITTSTTHLPPLDLLKETRSLVGFPGLDYISSPKVRAAINNGDVKELGQNQTLNVEEVLLLKPDVFIGFGVEGGNDNYKTIAQAGVPVIYNGEWTEQHPLGKAEWIKVFGVLYNKLEEAQEIFDEIEQNYLEAKNKVTALEKPTVIGGATWKDTWYLPYGDSWQGKLIKDAGGDYIYAATTGSGSLSYNIEKVLKDGHMADFWIAPGQYTNYSKMAMDQPAYKKFKAFNDKQVYTFARTKGEKGGITYYEEASMRPDIVLQDLVHILHPELDPKYEGYFFKPLLDE